MQRILLASLLAFTCAMLRATDEQELITILQSTAGVTEKCAACQQLRILGTAKSVPALAALLTEERTTHAARYVLEAISGPEAGAALRDALGKTSGLIKVGVIDSLGRRREVKTLPLLEPLLTYADPVIAAAAATALGRIGGKEAVAALSAVRTESPAAVQIAVADALLQCAERLLASGDRPAASAVYRSLLDANGPPQILLAAWRGVVLSNPDQRVDLITKALAGRDGWAHVAALQLVRELGDAKVIKACLKQWKKLPADSQVALLDANLKLRVKTLPTVRAAIGSPHLSVRAAAWQMLANLEDSSLLPALARAAAQGAPAERDAARDTLTRLRGPGIDKAILKQIRKGEPSVKAELLHALGERGDLGATAVLLQYAGDGNEPVRLAALDSLRKLAVADTLAPLLNFASQAKSERERVPVLDALSAVCQASPDKEQATRHVVETLHRLPTAQRRHLLPLLIELGTPAAQAEATAASKAADLALAKEGIRVLTQWPNASAAAALLDLARTGTDPTLQLLALSGCITVAEQETNLVKRFDLIQQAMATAKRPEEKRQALGQIGLIPTPVALQAALGEVTDSSLATEAGLAAVTIAEKLATTHPQLANEAAVKVLAYCQSPDIIKRAWGLRHQSKISAPFIRDWLVCGPFRPAGATGADAIFNTEFGPEKPGVAVSWKPLPRAEQANLGAFFPDQMNCAAYLQTQIIALQDSKAVLLIGSDDGVKAWLNGTLVHSHNIDRGLTPDQDIALIELRKGVNQLRLKITQGGGGWMACARIVGRDGSPIAGLRIEPQSEAGPRDAMPSDNRR